MGLAVSRQDITTEGGKAPPLEGRRCPPWAERLLQGAFKRRPGESEEQACQPRGGRANRAGWGCLKDGGGSAWLATARREGRERNLERPQGHAQQSLSDQSVDRGFLSKGGEEHWAVLGGEWHAVTRGAAAGGGTGGSWVATFSVVSTPSPCQRVLTASWPERTEILSWPQDQGPGSLWTLSPCPLLPGGGL